MVKKKNISEYVPSGSFVRAVLLSGVVVGTGTGTADDPEPIVLRLVDHGIFSKKHYTQQIKEAIVIGSCTGHISSERAKCRLESLSLMNKEGKIIEKSKVEGWVMGEDGRSGIKGMVVDKSSDVARMAILSGILSGLSQFMQNQAFNGKVLALPIAGSSRQKGMQAQDALKMGTLTGGSNAFDKLADYAIKRAEQMSPVIVIGSGRVVDIVFRKGFGLKADNDNEVGVTQKSGIESINNQQEWQSSNNHENVNKMQQKFLEEGDIPSQPMPVNPYAGGM